jgi:hemerythrin-like domain-containing protein
MRRLRAVKARRPARRQAEGHTLAPGSIMASTALRTIRDEHQALAAMLRSMLMLVRQDQATQHAPDFGVLRAMLFYVDEFPERLHHPKESNLLFPLLRKRCPQLVPVLDRLDADHQRGEASIRRVEHALLAWEVLGAPRRAAFVHQLQGYVDRYLDHMAVEETQVLPVAQRELTAAEWQVLDEAFASNRDPLTGHAMDDVYQPLFSRITQRAPAPVGLG